MNDFRYADFEEYFRGNEIALSGRAEESAALARHFSRWGARSCLDVGCGRGDFIAAAATFGLEATGIESDPDLAESARRAGGNILYGDASKILETLWQDQRLFDIVLAQHVIEHFDPQSARELVYRMARVLAPGGRLAIITPNCADIRVVGRQFYLDPTHVRPYPRNLLEFMLSSCGLVIEEARYFERFADMADAVPQPNLRAPRERISQIVNAGNTLRLYILKKLGMWNAIRDLLTYLEELEDLLMGTQEAGLNTLVVGRR